MGFLSDLLESAKRVAGAAWTKTKEITGKAVQWMAEKAEQFIGSVKKAWQIVKPFVGKLQAGLKIAAAAAAGIPWLKAALLAVDKGITALTAFENSPIAGMIDKAIKFSIDLAKKWQAGKEQQLEGEELVEAKKHQETFRVVEMEAASETEQHQIGLMAAITDFEISKADLAKALEGEPSNFEHYLRLRATQKLLNMSAKRFTSAKTTDDLSADDLFLVRVASDLIKENPELSHRAADRIDKILDQKYGKTLQSFVYEELIASWKMDSVELGKDIEKATDFLAKNTVRLRGLESDKKIQNELSEADQKALESLEIEVPKLKESMDELAARQRDVERYANAAEGFLQLLEKTPEQLEMEDRGYVLEEGGTVGEIIIRVANEKIPFSSLSKEDQALIIDFANVFKNDANNRMTVLEVAAA